MEDGGAIVRCDPMPLAGGKVAPEPIAELYREYEIEVAFEKPHLVIEQLFTLPTDALPQKGLDCFRTLFSEAGQYLTACDGGYAQIESLDALRVAYKECSPFADAKMRVDGRKGLLSYAKGAGYLFMPALWGWPITEVKPAIWARSIKEGVDRSLSTKDQSFKVARSLWPEEMAQGGRFWKSDRCKRPDEGMVEAALIAEWFRRKLAKGAA